MRAMSPTRLWPSLVIFVAALGIRIAYFLQIRSSPFFDFLQLDPLYYHRWATRIAGGEWIGHEVFEMSPLYSYLLALWILARGDDLTMLRIVQFTVGALTCVMTGRLAERIFDRRVGLIAGLGCAAYGPFLFYEGQVMKEFLTPAFATAAMLLLLAPRDDRAGGSPDPEAPIPPASRLRLAAAGALLAAAALVRDNFLLLIGILAAWIWITSRRRAVSAAAFTAGALALLVPVGVRNLAVGGDFVLTTSGGGEVFYIGNGPYANGAYVPPPWVRSNPVHEHQDFRDKAREITGRDLSRGEASRFWWREGISWSARHPWRTLKLWGRKIALFWNDHELPDNYSYASFIPFAPMLGFMLTLGPVAALGAAGSVLAAGSWRRCLPIYLAMGGYMVSVVIFFNFARFRLPFVPLLMILAARGVAGLYDAGRGLVSRRRIRAREAWAFAVLVAAIPLVHVDLSSASEEPFQDRLHLAAAWRQAGEPARAEEVLRHVIREADAVVRDRGGDPDRPETIPGGVTFRLALSAAWRDLGGALQDQGRIEEAVPALRRAALLSPGDAPLRVQIAAALREAGNAAGAEAALREALTIDPESFTARFDLATLHYENGRAGVALRELERARAATRPLSPLDLADWHYGMGAVLLALGRDAEALPHLREGLRLNPDASQAAEAAAVLDSVDAPE